MSRRGSDKGSGWIGILIVVAAVLAVAGIVLLPVGRRDVPTAAREAASATIPDVVGMPASEAEAALRVLELDVRVAGPPANPGRCRVTAQDPGPGTGLR